MSTQAPTLPTSSTGQTKTKSQAQQYVEGQLAQTGRQVVTNDLVTALVGALSWVMGCLVSAIIVDAWILPLTVALRWTVLIVLVGGLVFWLVWRLYPIFFRRVNPTYSAQMIERSKEQFHNSLLNYTLLNDEEAVVNQHVLQVVTHKAAQDLSQVAGIERIDRSGLIRLGIAFVCLVALFVAYTILSPKSPWPSIMRVLAPNADVNRPSAVAITNVLPGDTDVFFGRRLLVSCQVKGKHDPDSVLVILSTDDGRMSQVRQFMRLADEETSTYQIELTTSPKGIDSSFVYRIEAGDGQTRDYRVKVNMNPTITVDSVTINSPAYTKIPERTFSSTANLSGVEGARVKVSAIANLPIGSANIELLNIPADAPAQSGTIVSTIKMVALENQAEGEFSLTFNRRANVPDFTHFQLRFTSTSGDRNENTNVYSIRIIPDLGPEIRFVKPVEKEIRVPVNQLANLEIAANDLDYELESVRLFVEHRGTTLLNESLPFPSAENRRIFEGRYPLSPDRLQLKPGDEVLIYAKAADNRHAPINDIPEPNEARTENYRLIVEPPAEQPQESQDKKSDENDSAGGENSPPDNQQSEDQQDSAQGDKESNSEEEKSEGDSESKGEKESAGDGSEIDQEMNEGNDDSKGEKGDQGEAKEGDSSDGENESSDGTGGDADSKPKGDSSEGIADQNDANDSSDPSQSQSSNDANSGNGNQPDSDSDTGQRDRNLHDGEQSPLDEDATDSERFERIRQMMEREQQNKQNSGSDSDDPNPQQQDQQDRQPPNSDDAKSGNQNKPPQDKQDEGNPPKNDGNSGTENRPPEGKEPPQQQPPDNGKGDSGDKPPSDQEQTKDEEGAGKEDSETTEKPKQDSEGDSKSEQSDPQSTDPNQSKDQTQEGDSSQQTGDNSTGQDGPEKQGDASQGTEKSSQPSQGDPYDSKTSEPGNEQSPADQSGNPSANNQTGGGSGGGNSPGGDSENVDSKPKASDSPPPKLGENLPIEEREELKFKKDATDLALKYLKDQPEGPERDELLRQLNMTEDQLADFMKRWQEMADKAKAGDAKAQQFYERALRSLGLKTPQSQIKGQTQRMENLSEGGAVSRPPAEVQDSFQDFLRNLNRQSPRRDD